MNNTVTKTQIEWWQKKRELIQGMVEDASDALIQKTLIENLEYIDSKIEELEKKLIRHRKVGTCNG